MEKKVTVVFVHGWSVTNMNTYGGLPIRLRLEAETLGWEISIAEIFLGRYVSFHDEVKLEDISRAFTRALKDQHLEDKKFVCITHSTGGPVVRDWWHRFYKDGRCPMSHLIMLAPANFGSALAQLGKARVGRLKSWLEGIEPGQGVLDWLELGSAGSWNLNKEWITGKGPHIQETGPFPFVLTGQYIDRKLYDHLNSYTGEMGSDGVVRVASANLEGRYVKLQQVKPVLNAPRKLEANTLEIAEFAESPPTPLRIISGKSHSGDKMGIMGSVKADPGDDRSDALVKAILECISVASLKQYETVRQNFAEDTAAVMAAEKIEVDENFFLQDRYFIHDEYAMIIFKVVDSEGYPVRDYDLIITAGEKSNPNFLPVGFFVDKQRNRLSPETITYYLNYTVIKGAEPVMLKEEVGRGKNKREQMKEIRPAIKGIDRIGLQIKPRPEDGFTHYLPCEIEASRELFDQAFKANSTTLLEICLQRVVHAEVFQLDPLEKSMGNFKNIKPGPEIV